MPASSEVMAGIVKVPPFRTIFSGRTPMDLTQVRLGAGSPPVVTQTNVMASPGFTTIGSSTRSLIDGEAGKQVEKKRIAHEGRWHCPLYEIPKIQVARLFP